MNSPDPCRHVVSQWAQTNLPKSRAANSARWWINGYPATITIWTDEEWECLSERPIDAQRLPCGVWCTLRMD
jgi:hypothetical protein